MENEGFAKLFGVTGQAELAETPFGGTRSKGSGVVQFLQAREARTIIAKYSATSV